MKPLGYVLMVLFAVLVVRAAKKDFVGGLALAAGLLVSMPDYMRISIGGGIPEITIHRLLLGCLLICWFGRPKDRAELPGIPLMRWVVVFGVVQFVSMLLSVHFSGSIKSFFVYALEIGMFFKIVSSVLRTREDVLRVMGGITAGLGVVAVIAAIERNREFNISLEYLMGDGRGMEDVTATYPHRILLGYGMAMAVPILMAVREKELQPRRRLIYTGLLLLTVGGCYFANSRGPWSGLVLAAGILFVLGSKDMRKLFGLISILAVFVIASRQGVRDTLLSAVSTTVGADKDSLKRKSAEYRLMLWKVASSEVKKSPERMLFGYGGLSTEIMDLSEYFEKESGGNTALLGFTSWDNQLACDLIEFGYVGLAIEIVLLLSILMKFAVLWRKSGGVDRSIMAAFIGVAAIYSYAMTTVYLFSPQIKCLFWALVACGIRYGDLGFVAAPEVASKGEVKVDDIGYRTVTSGLG